ncbi:zinc knuckle CX2CX4HX4C containing protein [Tanacetum coccineum]
MNIGEALLHGVPERLNKLDPDSDTDIMVSDVNALNIPNHDVVAELFGVSLKSYKDIDDFTKGIELGKYPMWLELTREKRKEVLDTIGDIWDALVEVTRASSSDPVVSKSTKSTSYVGVAGASANDQPKVSSNFCPLVVDPIFDGVNISIHHKVVEKAGLETVLEGGHLLIRNSLIFLMKWSMDTRLHKEELTRILIWVKLHDVPIYVFEEDEADLVDVVTISIPSLTGDGFTKETIRVEYEWKPPRCDICKIFGHVHDHYLIKVVSLHIVTTSTIVAPTVVKLNDGFQMVGKKRRGKVNPSLLMVASLFVLRLNKVLDMSQSNISTSNSFSALNDDEEDEDEDVEIVHDESANLFPDTKTGRSSYFMATAD